MTYQKVRPCRVCETDDHLGAFTYDGRCTRIECLKCNAFGPSEGRKGDGKGGGYGRVCIDGGTMATHIVMWVCEHGPIPPRKQLDHGDDCQGRRHCCNPAHLELVTHKENMRRRDRRAAERMARMTAVRKYNPRADHYPSKAAIKRAVETARDLGLTVVGVEVSREGVIKVLDQAAVAASKPMDEFEQWQASGKLG